MNLRAKLVYVSKLQGSKQKSKPRFDFVMLLDTVMFAKLSLVVNTAATRTCLPVLDFPRCLEYLGPAINTKHTICTMPVILTDCFMWDGNVVMTTIPKALLSTPSGLSLHFNLSHAGRGPHFCDPSAACQTKHPRRDDGPCLH